LPRHGEFEERRPIALNGPKIAVDGMLELAPKGFGFLRVPHKNFEQARDDVFVSPESIRKHNLRLGQWIHGNYQEGPRGPQLVEITAVNGTPPEEAAKFPHFDELKAINPSKRISFETTPERFTTRVVDIMAPVGRGQRGLIVSPPRSGKTTLLLHMAEAVREKYDESIHLMVLLVDERPEEVTEFRRTLPGAEIYASSNDEQPRNHCRIAELAIERAKRLVEAGKDVFLLMDSITRLARAYNNTMNNRGRGTGSGGITIGALEVPRRLFAAARNTRGGGSLTILATALIQTNSRADEAIFMEFKGTGNMELVLDRKIAENYIYPAVDIFKSGTRREELLIPEHMLHKIHLIRRGLSGHRPVEAMERLLFFLKKFPNNPQMLLEIKG
jgi:transcription termination factor Rho